MDDFSDNEDGAISDRLTIALAIVCAVLISAAAVIANF
jgi:hypothetical protein